ncbi:MAG: ABC transporter ATP-binding protein [Lachnospiraceae bacterium]|nr:ABC transporter ATP-binding protein [Lachnospiraceae bacterium]
MEKNRLQTEPIIRFRDFGFRYFSQEKPTLYGIDLDIFPGEKILIAGPSGSGKSTLAHCINGLIPFSYKGEMTGSLTVGGIETKDADIFSLSKTVGTVLQDSDAQFIGLSVGEDIAFTLENDRMALTPMREAVRKAAESVDIGQLLKASPFELSGGQKQRVSFAGVMVAGVDVLLFDEPLANLDPATGKTAVDLIDRMQQEYGKTVIIIEHRLEDVLYRPVDRIVVVSEGRIAADLPPDELIAEGLLPRFGIREPLYAAAMKQAGIAVKVSHHAGRFETLTLSEQDREKLAAWGSEPLLPAPPAGKELLRAEHLSFRYNEHRNVIKDISFTIRAGEMVSVVGTNGAGKSTLAKLICGFVREDAGALYFEGEDLKGQTIRERAQKIGYIMQNPNQMISKAMLFDEVALGLRIRGESGEAVTEKVHRALKVCGLYPFRKWPVSALSYGQKKRVTIASMLVMEPRLLILDEPTAGQDWHHYTEIMEFLKSLNAQGVTILMITHDMHLMLEYTTHAIVVHDGTVIGDSTAVDILTNPEIAGCASLKLTSLYDLAEKTGISDAQRFVQRFIDDENKAV